MNLREVTFVLDEMVIDGLACKTCVRKTLDQLRAIEGVVAVSVGTTPVMDEEEGLDVGLATLRYNPAFTDARKLRSTLEQTLGFGVREVRESVS